MGFKFNPFIFSGLDISGSGDVIGPASSADNGVPRFDGTTGKLLQSSGVVIDDTGNIITTGTISGSNILDRYTQTFNATSDWTLNGSVYEFSIPEASHLHNLHYHVQVFELSAGNYILTNVGVKVNSSNGNLTLSVNCTPDLRFVGKVILI